MKFDTLRKSAEKIQVWLKSENKIWHYTCMWRPKYTCM